MGLKVRVFPIKDALKLTRLIKLGFRLSGKFNEMFIAFFRL
ncbi:Uncharacterised protein [Legionella pneumophila]|nr:hypothetical protein lpymt_02597 [Legionella pneumophila]CZH53460.1 Uncharacterised protein [Legionella pneumophila]CZI49895.1 Uncharacterised protein [Legionella pneumophila]